MTTLEKNLKVYRRKPSIVKAMKVTNELLLPMREEDNIYYRGGHAVLVMGGVERKVNSGDYIVVYDNGTIGITPGSEFEAQYSEEVVTLPPLVYQPAGNQPTGKSPAELLAEAKTKQGGGK